MKLSSHLGSELFALGEDASHVLVQPSLRGTRQVDGRRMVLGVEAIRGPLDGHRMTLRGPTEGEKMAIDGRSEGTQRVISPPAPRGRAPCAATASRRERGLPSMWSSSGPSKGY